MLSRSSPYLRPPGELRPGAVPKIAENKNRANGKGLDELKRYMSGAFTPVSILFPTFNINANLLDNDILRHNFFRRAAEYLFRGLTFRKVLPEVGLFIDKDGGRMIMLYLYLQAIKTKQHMVP